MKKIKSWAAIILALVIIVSMPVFAAANQEIGNVTLRVYPSAQYASNQTPIVGQNASDIQVKPSCSVSVISSYTTDSSGNTVTGKLTYSQYTLHVSVAADAGYSIAAAATAAVNNEACSINVTGSGSAEISWTFTATPIAPTIYHNPSDEKHQIGETFSFTATCSDPDAKQQWYIYDQVNNRYTPEEMKSGYPQMEFVVSKLDNGTARLNIHNAVEGVDGWSVACAFTNDAGTVFTERAFCKITNATVSTAAPSIYIVDPAEATDSDDNLPAGTYLMEEPSPSIYVVETPEPEASPAATETAEVETEQKAGKTTSPALKVLKWVGICVGALVLAVGIIILIQYFKDKSRRERSAKMAKTKNDSYRGRH